MRKYVVLMVMTMLMAFTASTVAQTMFPLPKDLAKKAKKEAKALIKEGWKPFPSELPIPQQVERSYAMQVSHIVKYKTGNGLGSASDLNIACMQAEEMARKSLAAQIKTDVKSLVSQYDQDVQKNGEDVESMSKSVISIEARVQETLGSTHPLLKIYRTLPNGQKEVQVTLTCDMTEFIK
jgi:hypothetical protein